MRNFIYLHLIKKIYLFTFDKKIFTTQICKIILVKMNILYISESSL